MQCFQYHRYYTGHYEVAVYGDNGTAIDQNVGNSIEATFELLPGTYTAIVHGVVHNSQGPYSQQLFKWIDFEVDSAPAPVTTVVEDGGHNVTSELWIKAILEVADNPVTLKWKMVGADIISNSNQVISGYFYADPNDFVYGSAYNPELFVKIYIAANGWCNIAFNHVTVDNVDISSAHQYGGLADQSGMATLDRRLVEHQYTNVQISHDPSDGDGYTEDQGDCNDSNADIHPGAMEQCGDGVDNDCDGYSDCTDLDCAGHANCSQYYDNKNGTATDNYSSLMWQKDVDDTKRNWEEAVNYCQNLEPGQYSDWRLPESNELTGLWIPENSTSYNCFIDPVFSCVTGY